MLGSLSEYTGLISKQPRPFRLPENLEEAGRWLLWLVAAYLAIRVVGAVVGWISGRR
jgi:hypothetical protein